jgi:hypothetical protein
VSVRRSPGAYEGSVMLLVVVTTAVTQPGAHCDNQPSLETLWPWVKPVPVRDHLLPSTMLHGEYVSASQGRTPTMTAIAVASHAALMTDASNGMCR